MAKLEFDVSIKDGGLKELNRQIREQNQLTTELIAKYGKESETAQKAGIVLGRLKDQKRELLKATTELSGGVKKSAAQLLEMGENITVVAAGISAALKGITDLAKESIQLGAKFGVLRSNFKGAEEDLQLLRQATAGTVTDANLIKLSNQAEDLGISLKDQALLFSLAEDAGDKYGGSVEENFQRVVMATEGNVKGLKSLGIQKAAYEQTVQDLVKAHGGETESIQGVNGEREISIKKLDAETQKQIRLEAILKLTGATLDDVKNKTQDQADKLEALGVRVEEAKTKFGTLLMNGVEPLITGFLNLGNAGTVVVGGFGYIVSSAVPLAATIAQLKIAFPGLATAVTSSTIAMTSAWGAMVTAILLGAQQIKSNLGIDLFSTNIMSDIQGLATSDFWINRSIDKGVESMKKTGMDKPITDKLIQDAIKNNEKKYQEYMKIPKVQVPQTSRGGSKGGAVQQEQVLLNLYDAQLETIKNIQEELKRNEGYTGAILDLTDKLKKAEEELYYLKTGVKYEDMKREEFLRRSANLNITTPVVEPLQTLTGGTSFIQSKDMMVVFESMIKPLTESFSTAFEGVFGTIRNLSIFFGEAGQGFINDLVDGFDRVLTIVNAIISIFETIKAAQSFLSIITSFIPGGGALSAGMKAPMISPRISTSTNVYINANMDGLTFLKSNMPAYNNYKNYRRL